MEHFVVPENITIPPPPPPRRATGIRGGGVQKEAFSERIEVAYRGIFPGGLSKIGEFLINNCFSVEQAFSYLTVNGLQNKYYLPTVVNAFFMA